jgi:PAS domain-containing protein
MSEVWERAVAVGEPYEIRYRIRRAADGMYRWFLVRAWPQKDGRGGWSSGWARAPTSRPDRGRGKAPAAAQRLASHVENTPLANVEWDSEFRVAAWSPKAEALFGWPAAEVAGKHPASSRSSIPMTRPMSTP